MFYNKFVALTKKVRVKAISKPWFDTEIISGTQKSDKLYSRYKSYSLKRTKTISKLQKYLFKICCTGRKALIKVPKNYTFFYQKIIFLPKPQFS